MMLGNIIDSDTPRGRTQMVICHARDIMQAFLRDGSCHLKRDVNSHRDYGVVYLEDLIKGKFDVHLKGSKTKIEYKDAKDLICSGNWLLD